MNESDLIVSIQNGDSDSFRKLYEQYINKAVRTAYLITGNRATAEDVAQEAFVKCYFEIGKLQNPQCFRSWFYRLPGQQSSRILIDKSINATNNIISVIKCRKFTIVGYN